MCGVEDKGERPSSCLLPQGRLGNLDPGSGECENRPCASPAVKFGRVLPVSPIGNRVELALFVEVAGEPVQRSRGTGQSVQPLPHRNTWKHDPVPPWGSTIDLTFIVWSRMRDHKGHDSRRALYP